jgi:multidrug efflux pump subunit AcrB
VLVSLTLAPMLCSRCMRRAEEHGRFSERLRQGSIYCCRAIVTRSTVCCVIARSHSGYSLPPWH